MRAGVLLFAKPTREHSCVRYCFGEMKAYAICFWRTKLSERACKAGVVSLVLSATIGQEQGPANALGRRISQTQSSGEDPSQGQRDVPPPLPEALDHGSRGIASLHLWPEGDSACPGPDSAAEIGEVREPPPVSTLGDDARWFYERITE